MSKFLATLPDQYIHVEADNAHDAALAAFARFVRDLSPSHFSVRELEKADPLCGDPE